VIEGEVRRHSPAFSVVPLHPPPRLILIENGLIVKDIDTPFIDEIIVSEPVLGRARTMFKYSRPHVCLKVVAWLSTPQRVLSTKDLFNNPVNVLVGESSLVAFPVQLVACKKKNKST